MSGSAQGASGGREAILRVFRGDASGGQEVEYKVPVDPGMVVLDAVHWIQGHQAPLRLQFCCHRGSLLLVSRIGQMQRRGVLDLGLEIACELVETALLVGFRGFANKLRAVEICLRRQITSALDQLSQRFSGTDGIHARGLEFAFQAH